MGVAAVREQGALGHDAITAAIERAADFLRGAQQGGWWRDFDTLAGTSDEWVTAYVGCALSQASRERSRAPLQDAWRRLRSRRWWSAGWGYNRLVPRDSDSTLWVLAFLDAIGAPRELRIRRARRWLARHARADGGVTTFPITRAIRLYTRLSPDVSFDGWRSAHTCVTALAASLDLPFSDRSLGCVRRAQAMDGSWPGASLARIEARIALEPVLESLPRLRIARRADAVVRSTAFQLRGLTQLWIEVEGRS